jgi:hypothetical protein
VVWLELYDLQNDPQEMRNLASDPAYAKIRDELADALVTHKTSIANAPNPG